jgi:hypothetical protein
LDEGARFLGLEALNYEAGVGKSGT